MYLTTTVDCGPPSVPRNGSLESYSIRTEGSVLFYSCDPGLVPEGRMRTVCTENGWRPNPADLNCFSSTCIPDSRGSRPGDSSLPSFLPRSPSLSTHPPTSLTFHQRDYEKKYSLKLNCSSTATLLPEAKPSKLQYSQPWCLGHEPTCLY